ncbi:MAG TPA: hypothetical protein VEP90_11870, partial [Methylomirabilota bacterium]|nr:hypothetical protein [Methylomirabilota bacterium]
GICAVCGIGLIRFGRLLPQGTVSNTPTPPLIVDWPTKAEIEAVMFSKKNVYTSAMTNLTLDIDTSHVSEGGQIFWTRKITKWVYFPEQDIQVADFTFQAQLSVNELFFKRYLYSGIVARIGNQSGIGYAFAVKASTSYKEFYEKRVDTDYEICLIQTRSPLTGDVLSEPKRGYPLVYKDRKKLMGFPLDDFDRHILIAVVAQGDTLDFYANLTHLARITDNTVSRGTLGAYSLQEAPVLYDHVKLWTK